VAVAIVANTVNRVRGGVRNARSSSDAG